MRNIKSFCPDIEKWIEVIDNWYPSYKIRGKFYVQAAIRVYDIKNELAFRICSCEEEVNEKGYMIYCSFWGADDTYMAKEILVDNQEQAIVEYRKLRKLLNKLNKQKAKELQSYLYRLDFVYCL